MRKMPVKVLLLVWAIGLVLVAVEYRALFQDARAGRPLAEAQMRARRDAETLRQRDSMIAFARAPITVTASGDSVRAVAYTALTSVSAGTPSSLLGLMIVAWVFKIPLALLVFTIAWLIARFLPSRPESPLHGELA